MAPINITFLLLGIAILLLVASKLRSDVVALVIMLAFGLSSVLTPQEVFSGFSRAAVIVMLSAFMLAEGLRRTGITEKVGAHIVRLFGRGEKRLIFGVMMAGAFFSLFMNNIAAASLLFPSVSGVSRRSQISQSRLLMPLAFGTILGGTATLLTTTNIIVSGLLRNMDLPAFGLLDFAPIGIPITLIGILFMVFWGHKYLPEKSPAERVEGGDGEALLGNYQLGDRLLRGRIRVNGSLNGKTLQESGLREAYHLNVIAIQRGKRAIPIEAKTVLKGNDILLIMARMEDTLPVPLNEMLENLPSGEWQREYLSTPDMMLIETAIAPRSHLASQTLRDIRFEHKFNAKVLAIWRQGRSIRTRLETQPLEFGDGLLLQGTLKSLDLLRTEPGLILLAESMPRGDITVRGWVTILIMLLTLILAVMFPALIAEIMLSGAVLMVLIGSLDMDQAYRAIEWRSVFLVASMLSVGVAMEKTGAAVLLAEKVVSLMGETGHLGILAGLVILTVLLTQVINGAAAVTVVAPIAIVVAQSVHMEPRSVAMAVALASSMAFMSPLGHAVNVMVMGAGGYTFRDYARIGIPLTIILVLFLLIALPLIMPLG
jgi:di/tricarboxylate transporter